MTTWMSNVASTAAAAAILLGIFLLSWYCTAVAEILRVVFLVARLLH
jgi:hypothetical protein